MTSFEPLCHTLDCDQDHEHRPEEGCCAFGCPRCAFLETLSIPADVKRERQALAVVPRRMEGIIRDIVAERARQDRLHGDQSRRPPFEWLGIVSEEYGEASKEVCKMEFANPRHREYIAAHSTALRTELIQTAASVVAMIEVGDKMCWWPMTGEEEEQCTGS